VITGSRLQPTQKEDKKTEKNVKLWHFLPQDADAFLIDRFNVIRYNGIPSLFSP
jgi:hypothetical protein